MKTAGFGLIFIIILIWIILTSFSILIFTKYSFLQNLIINKNLKTRNENKEIEIMYSVSVNGSVSSYEHNKTGKPYNDFTNIYSYNLKTKKQTLLFSDKDTPYFHPGVESTSGIHLLS